MVTISLCMIVRNEEQVLSRCLDSIKSIVDEIIIIDTGSEDNTKDIAMQYTPNVYDFQWIDDFAAARNISFEKATMNYCMWMDADDILPETEQQKLVEWKTNTNLSTAPDVVMLKYVTAFDKDEQPSFFYYRERLLRNGKFVWKGRVHEAIIPSGKIEYLNIYFEHRSIKTHYSKRNLKIYETMKLSGDELSPRDLFYYARELYYHNYHETALYYFEKFLKCPNAFIENQVEACRIASYCCYALHDSAKALYYLFHALTYRIPSGELCCDIGKHYLDREDYEQAIFWYQAAMNAPMKTENGGFVMEECYNYLPCIQLSVCYDRLQQPLDAIYYHRLAGAYQPTGELYLKNQPYFQFKEKEQML